MVYLTCQVSLCSFLFCHILNIFNLLYVDKKFAEKVDKLKGLYVIFLQTKSERS